MKALLLGIILLHVIVLEAKEYTMELDAVPGDEQIFFLDLKGIGAATPSFRVTTADGIDVPFSFDMRISRKEEEGKYKSEVNGYYSRETAPAAEKLFETPGFLSFKTVPGVKKYVFKFSDGAKETLSSPKPAVRGWWIELMRDPFLTNPSYAIRTKGKYRMLPGGGVEFTAPIQIPYTETTVDKRIDGRRIFSLLRCEGDFSLFEINLKNAVWPKYPAIKNYFKPMPGVLQDICSEGLLAANDAIEPKKPFWECNYVKGASVVKELHVQMPPSGREIGVSLKSDLFNEGDTIQINTYGGESESGIDFESGGIKGMRYGNWQGEKSILCKLTDKRGKCRLKSSQKEFQLKGIKEGFYTLTVEILLNGTGIVKKSFPIKVQKSPF